MIHNYKHNLALFKQVLETDEFGDNRESYVHLIDVRGTIQPTSGKENYEQRGITSEITHKVFIRYIPNLNIEPQDLLVYDNRTFDIQAVINENEANRYLTILVVEKLKDSRIWQKKKYSA